jgi:hypothetical protein
MFSGYPKFLNGFSLLKFKMMRRNDLCMSYFSSLLVGIGTRSRGHITLRTFSMVPRVASH